MHASQSRTFNACSVLLLRKPNCLQISLSTRMMTLCVSQNLVKTRHHLLCPGYPLDILSSTLHGPSWVGSLEVGVSPSLLSCISTWSFNSSGVYLCIEADLTYQSTKIAPQSSMIALSLYDSTECYLPRKPVGDTFFEELSRHIDTYMLPTGRPITVANLIYS